ncbi:MAG TPA: ABC transporter ATP-binding protein, partial [Planctomycetota bacterium]|nr:ABC transporter ATP-binding protein [Planctomycetota bacterium]
MPDTPAVMIEARGLSKMYRRFAAVENLSFAIPVGQIVAFLGPNGAGKSTAMRLLTGYLTPTSGQALIAGFDVSTNRIEAARRVGYLPENGPLYLDMTPRRLLRFFGEARGLEPARLSERLKSVIELCSLGDVLDKPIRKL